jgi:RHS repeat-associated protein
VASTYDAQDRLLSRGAVTYGWDALGGRRSRTEGSAVTQYVHDGLGALQSVTLPGGGVITYEYDGRHRRVAKRRDGVVEKRWVYDGQYRVAAEVDGTGTVTSRYVYGSQSHSPDYLLRGGVTYVYVKSQLGSVKLVVDATTRAVVQRLNYDAWGQVKEDSSPGFQPFGFAGGVYDADTKLTHFGFRDYDAQAGVWTSKDPIRLGGGANCYGCGSFGSTCMTAPHSTTRRLGRRFEGLESAGGSPFAKRA